MSRKIYNKPKRVQFIYFLLIFISGGALFYIKTLPDDEQNFWLMIFLLIILMYSLLKSTKNWSYDNPKPKEDEEEKETLEYKNPDIPSLEDMIKEHVKKKNNETG